ncbi:hypothetical protein NKI56_24655 [Mesorhizobium sp. M0622]|uniref:hypothetical protein n=1 Tax=unclassified Mesorhizobium TaxID=325217 RepID=UPI00333A5A6F
MPRAELKPGRQVQEIGAAIVGAWLKLLPASSRILSMDSTNPLTITIDRQIFAVGDTIRLRPEAGRVIGDIRVQATAAGTAPHSQTLTIEDLNGQPIIYGDDPLDGGDAIPDAAAYADLKRDLKMVLEDIVEAGVSVEVHVDEPNLINVVVPQVPRGVLTRGDLIDYLHNYHKYAQGRHYHDELATAVLFGCR